MSRQTWLTPQIRRLFGRLPDRQIAARAGVTPSAVTKARRRLRLPLSPLLCRSQQRQSALIAALIKGPKTIRELATLTGNSVRVVRWHLDILLDREVVEIDDWLDTTGRPAVWSVRGP
jgi:DNA-binding transcriptional ArsR family regulator